MALAKIAMPPTVESSAKRAASAAGSVAFAHSRSCVWTTASARKAPIVAHGTLGAAAEVAAPPAPSGGPRGRAEGAVAGEHDRAGGAGRAEAERQRQPEGDAQRRLGQQAGRRAAVAALAVQAPARERDRRSRRQRGGESEHERDREAERGRQERRAHRHGGGAAQPPCRQSRQAGQGPPGPLGG